MNKFLSVVMSICIALSSGLCLAGEEFQLPQSIDRPVIVYPDRIVKGTITLSAGWNLVAVPVVPLSSLTVEDFIKLVDSQFREFDYNGIHLVKPDYWRMDHWTVKVVAVYKNGRFERYPRKHVTYNMVPGEAYFVYAEYTGSPIYKTQVDVDHGQIIPFKPNITVTIVGREISHPVSVNLNRKWNGLSVKGRDLAIRKYPQPVIGQGGVELPPIPELDKPEGEIVGSEFRKPPIFMPVLSGSSLSQLSRELQDQGIKATRIAFWDAYRQEWQQHKLPFAQVPPTVEPYQDMLFDRIIRPDEGFFLLCEENGLYIPGLSRRVVYPPIPKRVSYTGTIRHMGAYIPESKPPYSYILEYFTHPDYSDGVTGGAMIRHQVPLKGVNESMESMLAQYAAKEDEITLAHTVSGVMTTITYPSMLPPFELKADVLVVDSIDAMELVKIQPQ